MMAELSDVPVHSLVPEPLRSIASADEFMAALPQYDGEMAQQLDNATAAGDCLRFVGEPLLPESDMRKRWLGMHLAQRRHGDQLIIIKSSSNLDGLPAS